MRRRKGRGGCCQSHPGDNSNADGCQGEPASKSHEIFLSLRTGRKLERGHAAASGRPRPSGDTRGGRDWFTAQQNLDRRQAQALISRADTHSVQSSIRGAFPAAGLVLGGPTARTCRGQGRRSRLVPGPWLARLAAGEARGLCRPGQSSRTKDAARAWSHNRRALAGRVRPLLAGRVRPLLERVTGLRLAGTTRPEFEAYLYRVTMEWTCSQLPEGVANDIYVEAVQVPGVRDHEPGRDGRARRSAYRGLGHAAARRDQ